MKKLIFIVCSQFMAAFLFAQDITIIPKPYKIEIPGKGLPFVCTRSTRLLYNDTGSKKITELFNFYLEKNYGFTLPQELFSEKEPDPERMPGNSIIFFTNPEEFSEKGKEEFYELLVSPRWILINGQQAGLFFGAMSLLQMLPPDKPFTTALISSCNIMDAPRFKYRGMHLDVCRHFFPVSFIKKYIDYLALHKFNYFHWHLTDDQGWRIEIKKYPELTATGGWRNGTIIGRYPGKGNDNKPHGGYYTQEEIKEVVQYAADRFITVIPEIEMPGHSSAAIAAYPWLSCFPGEPTKIPANMISGKSREEQKQGRIKLVQETWGVFDDVFCAGKDSTFTFIQNVLDEVMALFPSKYIHVGGDECPKSNWKRCPLCQARIKTEHLKDEHELQSYFIQRIEKYLNGKGRTVIGWDEILEGGLAPNAVVMSWRGESGGIEAAKQMHKVIMTPGNPVYFDHSQSENEDSVTIGGYNSLEKVYNYEPIPKELNEDQAKYILGAQANLWTEYIDNEKKAEYMIFPRMSALSEVLWSTKENRDWNDFGKRIPALFKRYDSWKANYSKAYYDLKATVLPASDNNGVLWEILSNNKDSFIRAYDDNEQSQYRGKDLNIKGKINNFHITKSGYYTASDFDTSHHQIITTLSQQFHFNKATGKKIWLLSPAADKYPGDGAFTLINGVQNEKGLSKSREFLGFSGTDCEAVIDLGKTGIIREVVVHFLDQPSSWIYAPSDLQIWTSGDDKNYSELLLDKSAVVSTFGQTNGTIKAVFNPAKTRYIKIKTGNAGTIPEDNPGAGNKAWLFIDEIEIN